MLPTLPQTVLYAPPVIFLMGPTASGKSALALELARHFPMEIVSVDSAQVYRGMDIGTAKPDARTLAAAPHHLIDLIDPTESYSAARFRKDALACCADIVAHGKVPLLAGGTMLYFNALTRGLSDLPEADAATRAQLDAEAAVLGWPALHAQLAKVDALTAARLKPADSQRIQRALEVFRLSGKPLSELTGKRQAELPYCVLKIALLPGDRAALHRRIAARFEDMLRLGLVDEVRALRSRFHLDADMPSMRCVGYRQVWEFLEGRPNEADMILRATAATRQLAKRQLTWLRAMDGIETFDCLRCDVADAVVARVRTFLAS